MYGKPYDPDTVESNTYRGYAVVHDRQGADIWSGSRYICTEPSLAEAKKVIDRWLEAR